MPIQKITSGIIEDGAVSAADIVSVSNTAITGNIISSQITSVANTQISGNIISSQITSIGGSQITANTIANSAIQTGAVENYMNATGLSFGMRNRIINGAMVIDQRNAGAASTSSINGYFLDRWHVTQSTAGKLIAQQNAGSVTPPTGFINYLGVTSQSAYSIAAGDYYRIYQPIEGLNMADLAWGTASAATVTLSFWVRSSLTGTFGGVLQNNANNRSYPFSYTISSANTWEQKTITIVGDTSGTWLTTNGVGMYVFFGLGVGSTYSGTAGSWAGANYLSSTGATSVVGTNGATFYITGVQLEKGSTATSFDYRPIGAELVLCQRYYYSTGSGTAGGHQLTTCLDHIIYSSGDAHGERFPVTMRTAPTVVLYGRTSSAGQPTRTDTGGVVTGTSTANSLSPVGFRRIILGQTLAGYPAYALEVSYTADAEL